MTIKQQGGVFGRNPTFNDVTVEGTLTVNGEPISDFGTMAQQDANAVNIDGGNIDGTAIGVSSPSSVSGTTGVFSGDLTVDTNTLFVDTANNRVGLGTATPDTRVEISDTFGTATSAVKIANASSAAVSNQGMIDFEFGNTFSGLHVDVRAGARKVNAGNHDSSFVIQTSTGGGDARDVVEVTKDGNIVLSLSGAGIDFSATAGTGTSELFDDYEEGTWTPAISDGTSSVNGSVGRYIKTGNVVVCGINIYYADISGFGAGQLRISGLPFANNGTYGSNNSLIASLSAASPVLAGVSGSNTFANLFKIPGTAGDGSSLTKADFVLSSAASCWGTFIYYTA